MKGDGEKVVSRMAWRGWWRVVDEVSKNNLGHMEKEDSPSREAHPRGKKAVMYED
jgi:hypothetical protein